MDVRRFSTIVLLAFALLMFVQPASLYSAPSKASEAADQPAQPQRDADAKNDQEEIDEYELQRILVDTIDQVERNYVKGISRRELVEAAIHGVLQKLDPYSTYISPRQIDRFRSEVENEFCGIGIQIDVEDGRLMVISPLVGTPAYEAGILAGDHIVAIDGVPTDGITVDVAVRRLKGREGSKVVLNVLHAGEIETINIPVIRGRIHVKTVLADSRDANDAWDYMLDKQHHIGYVRITVFGRETADDLRKVLENLKQQGLKGLILDLRFNPGGLLNSAIEVSDMFVPSGVIVSTSGRNVKQRKWEAKQPGTFADFPMVVLINRITASAGEIVAACLQDHHRAVVMGERTWGKGSVQNVISLEHGLSALKLTTAAYMRPSGKNIHRFPNSRDNDTWGVMPDEGFAVECSTADMIALIHDRSRRDIVDGAKKHENNSSKESETTPTKNAVVSDNSDNTASGANINETPEKQAETTTDNTSAAEKQQSTDASDENSGVHDDTCRDGTDNVSGAIAPTVNNDIDPLVKMALDYLVGELKKDNKKQSE